MLLRLYGEVADAFPAFTDFEREVRLWVETRRRA
jgi:hypothetical protein